MSQLIDDVLYLSRVTRAELREQEVDLSGLVALLLDRMREAEPARQVETKMRPGVMVTADGQLLRIALREPAGERLEVHRARSRRRGSSSA